MYFCLRKQDLRRNLVSLFLAQFSLTLVTCLRKLLCLILVCGEVCLVLCELNPSPIKTRAPRGLLTFSLRNSPIVSPLKCIQRYVECNFLTFWMSSPEQLICYPASSHCVVLSPSLVQRSIPLSYWLKLNIERVDSQSKWLVYLIILR